MIQIEPIQAIDGFGVGTWPGINSNSKEYFYSQGIGRTQFGVSPKWSISKSTDSGTLTNMVLGNWFSQGQFGANKYVYSFHADGRLNRAALGSASYTQQRFVNGVDSHGNGLI